MKTYYKIKQRVDVDLVKIFGDAEPVFENEEYAVDAAKVYLKELLPHARAEAKSNFHSGIAFTLEDAADDAAAKYSLLVVLVEEAEDGGCRDWPVKYMNISDMLFESLHL